MIAGHEVNAVPRGQPGQWRGVRRQLLHRAVDQITGHSDQVRLQPLTSATIPSTKPRLIVRPTCTSLI